MGEKGVGKLSQETPQPREGEPMGAMKPISLALCQPNDYQARSRSVKVV